MSNAIVKQPLLKPDVEAVICAGDISSLSAQQKVQYYTSLCNSLGLNPLSKPFEYLTLKGKTMLYARKDATDQLRRIHNISLQIMERSQVGDVYLVVARATTPEGRTDESIGAVSIGNLKGEALANELMKAETKAKRRVTLSIVGLGMLDETEVETIPGARIDVQATPTKEPEHPMRKTLIDLIAACTSMQDLEFVAAKIKAAGLTGVDRNVVGNAYAAKRTKLAAQPETTAVTDFEPIPEHLQGDAYLPKEVSR